LSKRRDGHHKKALFTTAQYGGHPAARDSEAGDGSVLGFGDPVATQARRYTSRPSDDFDVLADGVVVGRIMKAAAAPVGSAWTWTLAFGHHEDRTPTHGYAETREDAMAAFAKSWRRE